MPSSAQFDLSTLAAVKPGMDGSLSGIGKQLEQYLHDPNNGGAQLEHAHNEMHRLLGVLKMVRLDGIAVLCGEMDKVLEELAGHPELLSTLHRDILLRTLIDVMQYLDGLAAGADNATVRLFPQYQALQQLRGLEMSFELDLFFPNLAIALPASVLSVPREENASARLKAARSQYQQGLLRWLRQADVPASLHMMQLALEQALRCAEPGDARAFWWAAAAFLDCLQQDGMPPGQDVRKLLSRIDQQMRAVLEGNGDSDAEPVLNEILYLVGRSHTASELADAVRRAYALDRYLPELSALPAGELNQLLNVLRDQSHLAQDAWERCIEADAEACRQFAECVGSMVEQVEKLDRNSLQNLVQQIQSVVQYASDEEHARAVAMEVAMALLLLEYGIEHYSNLDSDFQERVRIVTKSMQSAARGQLEDPQRLAELVELHCRAEQSNVMAALAGEMLNNLHNIEQGLNAFFGNTALRDDLAGLARWAGQIRSCLRMLSLEQPDPLLVFILDNVRRFAQGGDIPKPLESRALANAVSALESYLQHLVYGQTGEIALLHEAMADIAGLAQAVAPPPAANGAALSKTLSRPAGEDQELLEVFLEEALEVLQIMRANLDACRQQPDNHEALVTIRRGFHTLKGSGRMVGLTELGEVAWCAERAMNKWLQDSKPASPGLLYFIGEAAQAFSGWVDELAQNGSAYVDAENIATMAQQIEQGIEIEVQTVAIEPPVEHAETPEVPAIAEAVEPAEPIQPVELVAPVEPLAQVEPVESQEQTLQEEPEVEIETEAQSEQARRQKETVTVGSVILSPMLFNIGSTESAQNVAALHQQLAALRTMAHPVVQYDFMRAAHTLAGVNRTMGFTAVVELAGTLENWLQTHMDQSFALGDAQMQLLESAIGALDAMVQAICAKNPPQEQSDLVQQLNADRERIEASQPVAQTEAIAEPAAMPWPLAQHPEAGEVEAPVPIVKEQPIEEEPIAEEPIAEEPIAEEPIAKEIVAEEAVAGEPLSGEEILAEPERLAREMLSATQKAAAAEKPQVRDDVDEQLLPVFMEEADDLIPKIGEELRAWHRKPQDERLVQSLKRMLHTLKGSSRMTGSMSIGELAHNMETRVLSAGAKVQSDEFWEALDSDLDDINAKLEYLRSGKYKTEHAKEFPAVSGKQHPEDMREGAQAALDKDRKEDSPAVAHGERRTGRREIRRLDDAEAERGANILRVRAEVVDRLVNEAGEISVARSRMEAEMRAFKDGLLELTGSVARLRAQLREVEIQAESQMQARISLTKDSSEQFDPLEFDRFTRLQELTRFMNESVHDVQTVQQSLLKNIDETAAAMSAQGRLNRELQQSLMNVRMVPFAGISDRLYRIVRQTSKELNKRANLELSGSHVELDRSVLEKMTAPFEHLLRNAIAHGLEDEQTRIRAGKNPIGEVRLSLRQESNEVVFEFSDDGAGLDFDALRAKAKSRGLLQSGAEASDEQMVQLIFVSGISTAAKVTEVAGRGIGMDVVRSEIAGLGGRIDVHSINGQGTHFIIHLPLTLAVTQTLMVRIGDAMYAMPSSMVEQVRQVKPAELEHFYRDRAIEWQGRKYPFHYLSHLVGDMARMPESMPYNPVLLMRSGEQRIAFHVDELLGNQESVVKNIGPQLSRLAGIAGATVLGNGRAVMILNPAHLAQRIGTLVRTTDKVEKEVLHKLPLIMVVDDSLTVRKITTRMLQRAGYQVITAKDGVDALEQLGEITPAAMLLDIEMPRMDGFELTKHLRNNERTKNLPIIMITSRTADKHRDYALELGVNAYLGKPYQEEELLQQIAEFAALPETA